LGLHCSHDGFVSNKIARPLTIVWWIAVALGIVAAIVR
jgi:hypothetical protein